MGPKEQHWDVRNWDEAAYRACLQRQREESTSIVYAARLAPSSNFLATASSNGSVSLYSVPSCVASQPANSNNREEQQAREPFLSLSRHDGAAYDLQYYGDGDNAILLSCGDDGKIQGWLWKHINKTACFGGKVWKRDFVLTNPQQKGLRGSLAPISETNGIATNSQEGCIYSASGSGHAYCWDLETQKLVITFEGHSDYLHCICSRPSYKQVITGSEDGTVRVWDCRSGTTVEILDTCNANKGSKVSKERCPWISCVAIDASEKWLVSGSGGNCLTLWSLLSFDAVTRISTLWAPQALTIDKNQIITVGAIPYLACFNFAGDVISQVGIAPLSAFSVSAYKSGVRIVAGYGGLVDIISEFGSHINSFVCK